MALDTAIELEPYLRGVELVTSASGGVAGESATRSVAALREASGEKVAKVRKKKAASCDCGSAKSEEYNIEDRYSLE